jgi:aspartate racemase
VLYSVNMTQMLHILETGKWNDLVDFLLDGIKVLHAAGAQFAAIAANTPHIVFNEIKSHSPLPMLSIVEQTCMKASYMGLTKVGLMGTKFTMQSDFYQKVFRQRGISIVLPHPDEQQVIHNKLMTEIELGVIKETTKQQLLFILKHMIEENYINGLILGCTELPLILDRDEYGIPFLNTTAIHIESIVQYCMKDYGELMQDNIEYRKENTSRTNH